MHKEVVQLQELELVMQTLKVVELLLEQALVMLNHKEVLQPLLVLETLNLKEVLQILLMLQV